jgi:hypothetical protein
MKFSREYILDMLTFTSKTVRPLISRITEDYIYICPRPGREAANSSLFSSEVKNGRAVRPLPHTSSWRGA